MLVCIIAYFVLVNLRPIRKTCKFSVTTMEIAPVGRRMSYRSKRTASLWDEEIVCTIGNNGLIRVCSAVSGVILKNRVKDGLSG